MVCQITPEVIIIIFLSVNIIYLLMGFGLLIVGALALSNVTGYISPLLGAIEIDSYQIGAMATTLSILFLIVGVCIMVVAVLGLSYAFAKPEKYTQAVYAVLVLVSLVVKIILIALWYTMKDKVEGSEMKTKMRTILINDFKDDTTMNANSVSNAWNYMFMTLDCCAVDPVNSTAINFDGTSWCTTSGSCQATSSQIPKTCCLNVDENTYSSAPSGCHASVNPGTYNSKGCYEALKDKLVSYANSIAGVAITITVLEVLVVILAALVYCIAWTGNDFVILFHIRNRSL